MGIVGVGVTGARRMPFKFTAEAYTPAGAATHRMRSLRLGRKRASRRAVGCAGRPEALGGESTDAALALAPVRDEHARTPKL
jgi:hypothetical protein